MIENTEILHLALENLEKTEHIRGRIIYHNDQTPEKIELVIGDNNLQFKPIVRKELRNYDLPGLKEKALEEKHLMVVAQRIFPKIREQLRENNIAYLEANGDLFFKRNNYYLRIEVKNPLKIKPEIGNRAFTKTGLRVVFYFLLNEQFINYPYRQIADMAEVGLGNINYIMTGLKQMGFLLKLNKHEYKLNNKKELLEKWMTGYEEKLKPNLLIGTFRFLHEQDFYNWKSVRLNQTKTVWGGEPGGDLFTDHLRPGEHTLYTLENRKELIANYRLVPDEIGKVKVYRKFWNYDVAHENVAPPLLIYTDLMNKNDKRCQETAQMIYEQLLKGNPPVNPILHT